MINENEKVVKIRIKATFQRTYLRQIVLIEKFRSEQPLTTRCALSAYLTILGCMISNYRPHITVCAPAFFWRD